MRKSILFMTVASLAIAPAIAQENGEYQDREADVETGRELPMQGNSQRLEVPAADSEVAQADDNDWITVSGRVQHVYNDSFILDYGNGDITVDMEEGYRDGFALEAGQNVTVSGRIDDGFLIRRTIEADSVKSAGLSQRYMAEGMEEDESFFSLFDQPDDHSAMEDEWLTVTGTVAEMDGDEMTLDVGSQTIFVDLEGVDEERALKPGDRVSVYGKMEEEDFWDFWDGREMVAQTVKPLG